MADVPFSEFKVGGDFAPSSYTIGSIAPGVTGTLLTITAPAGKKVRLIGLTASGTQSGITVAKDGAAVVNATNLETGAKTTGFVVGNMSSPGGASGVGGTGDGVNVIPYIQGSQSITISKNAGNTVATIYYSYQYGD